MRNWIVFGVFGLFVSSCLGFPINKKADVEDENENEMAGLEEYAKRVCGLDLGGQIQKVSPAEVTSSVDAFASYINTVSASLDTHGPNINTIINDLQSASMPDLMAHRTVFGNFLEALKSSASNSTCVFLQLFIVAKRLELAGPTKEFQETGCDNTARLVKYLDSIYGDKCSIAAAVTADVNLMRNVSTAITSDMECVLGEVSGYKDNLVQVQSDLASDLTVRNVLVDVAGLEASGSLLMRRITKFFKAVERVDNIIYDTQEECAAATMKTADVDIQGTILKLKDLLAALDDM